MLEPCIRPSLEIHQKFPEHDNSAQAAVTLNRRYALARKEEAHKGPNRWPDDGRYPDGWQEAEKKTSRLRQGAGLVS
jgi:hypothetical protein